MVSRIGKGMAKHNDVFLFQLFIYIRTIEVRTFQNERGTPEGRLCARVSFALSVCIALPRFPVSGIFGREITRIKYAFVLKQASMQVVSDQCYPAIGGE